MNNYRKITGCRISGSTQLVSVLNLGEQELTGVFPRHTSDPITKGPLELVWCPDSGLLQLNHSYNPDEMYGENYGYRSGLNQSMVQHLTNKVNQLSRNYPLTPGDLVLDIGSNDATTLKAYTLAGLKKLGIDPTGQKFAHYYPEDITLVADFFSADNFWQASNQPAKIVTSIAMFYDLEAPIEFARQVAQVLDNDGVWHFEQSYMPSMLRMNAYDTICHEHLEYYSLAVVKRILEAAGLMIIDVAMNAVNGGSFAVTAAKKGCQKYPVNTAIIEWMLGQEQRMGLEGIAVYRAFEARVYQHRQDLKRLIEAINQSGQRVMGYGASTKGNVLLQFCGFTADDIPAIAEVNPDKFGCYTPGTHIPIVSEAQVHDMQPDYLLVLPWHFKEGIIKREAAFLARGGKLIFPFPEIEIV